jgi:putative transposase
VAEWTLVQKRAVVNKLSPKYGVAFMCTLVGLNRSSYYHVAQDHPDDDVLESDLRKAAGNRPSDGYRRLTQTLRRRYKRYKTLNTKRVRRVMKRAGLNIKRRKKSRRTTNSQHGFQRYPNLTKDLKIDHPNQVWVGDIAAILLADGSEVFLAILMDVFTRKVVGWELSRDITHQLPLGALKRALRLGHPIIHHSDQGVQYATPKYTQLLLNRHVQISMAAVGKAWENGYAERWIRTLREEELSLTEYKNFADAYRQIHRFITDVYNRKRIHSSLGYLTPTEFEAQWRQQQP